MEKADAGLTAPRCPPRLTNPGWEFHGTCHARHALLLTGFTGNQGGKKLIIRKLAKQREPLLPPKRIKHTRINSLIPDGGSPGSGQLSGPYCQSFGPSRSRERTERSWRKLTVRSCRWQIHSGHPLSKLNGALDECAISSDLKTVAIDWSVVLEQLSR